MSAKQIVVIVFLFGVLLITASRMNSDKEFRNETIKQDISENNSTESEKKDLIVVDNPKAGGVISSPLHILGRARGTWYFEASFPITLYDSNGVRVGTSTIATAQSDWMTIDYVPFTATLVFEKPKTATGTLVFRKDNPSGDPERDNSISIPISF